MNSKSENKKLCVSSLVLGIIGLVSAFFVPAVSYSCSVTGLVIGLNKRKKCRSTAGIALNIVAITLAAINSICGIVMTLKMFCASKNSESKGEQKVEK